jgi:hypothetical protein
MSGQIAANILALWGNMAESGFRGMAEGVKPDTLALDQRTASTTLANSTSIPSPAVLTIRP